MKIGKLLLICVAAGLILTSSAPASTPPDASSTRFSSEKLQIIEENLILCLNSEYPGVRASAALTLRQLKEVAPEYSFTSSIIPLMGIVNDERYDNPSRIAAALALHALKSDRGDYAIRMTSQLTDVARVKFIYEHLAYARLQERLANR